MTDQNITSLTSTLNIWESHKLLVTITEGMLTLIISKLMM